MTMLKAYERWQQFDGQNFMGWMTTLMRNIWIDGRRHEQAKRRRLGQEVDLDLLAAPAPDWWRQLDSVRTIDAACRRCGLSSRHRNYLADYVAGLTSVEIADRRGTSAKTVRSVLTRTRRKFEEMGAQNDGRSKW